MQENNAEIQLFNEASLDIPIDLPVVQKMVSLLSKHESCEFSFLEIVIVDEEEILRLNKEHLDRNYITDTISFRYDEKHSRNDIEGTIFICAPRVYEQSIEYNQDDETEFRRILIHGLLHLCGYEDQTDKQKKQMTERENFYLHKIS